MYALLMLGSGPIPLKHTQAAHQNLAIVTSDKILQGGSVMIVVIVD